MQPGGRYSRINRRPWRAPYQRYREILPGAQQKEAFELARHSREGSVEKVAFELGLEELERV